MIGDLSLRGAVDNDPEISDWRPLGLELAAAAAAALGRCSSILWVPGATYSGFSDSRRPPQSESSEHFDVDYLLQEFATIRQKSTL